MTSMIHKAAIAAATGALLLGTAFAQAAVSLPAVHKSGQVEYLSGGVGQDEAKAIESASRQWPLTLEFAVKDKQKADFVADVNVMLRDAEGRTALKAVADGPFLLARVQPGHYTVDATFDGKTLHEKVLVKAGQPAKRFFEWPAGTGESHS